MDIQIHGMTSPALQEHAIQKLTAALEPVAPQVLGVTAKLTDLNGPSKGNDKNCHLTVRLKGEDPTILDETDDDIYEAVSKAATRLKHLMGKKHEKRLDKLHGR